MTTRDAVKILIAEDDEDDRLLIRDAFEESRLRNPIEFVVDGVELMDYLHRRSNYEHLKDTPLPGLILLDLNMQRKDGRTALTEIKESPKLRNIPVTILTTSKSEEDVFRSYGLGVNSFITKPVTFDGLVEVIKVLTHYWIEIVALPVEND